MLQSPIASQGAVFDTSGVYRYVLWRIWSCEDPSITFVMLNPGTASATTDDPTIRRCMGFARRWGYGGVIVVNLFAFRSSRPSDLYAAHDPAGPDNAGYLAAAFNEGADVVAGWGNGPLRLTSNPCSVLPLAGRVSCLGLTKLGQPRHPLYVPYSATRRPAYRMPGPSL